MTVRVLLFAVLREAVGIGEVVLDLPDGATGDDVLDRLAAEHAEIARYRSVTRLAINQRYAPTPTPLAEGDEVALITPVSGG